MHTNRSAALTSMAIVALSAAPVLAVEITNPGFEDTTDQTTHFEFTIGTPAGWTIHNPENLDLTPEDAYIGTLQPDGVTFFNETAPEGTRVAILFNAGLKGDGEYGLAQALSDVLQANTAYTLTVAVGNIASGTAQDGVVYDLSDFPGYRVDLLAGDVVIASDNNTLSIDEGAFATSTVAFTTGNDHPQLDTMLGIRLVNLNLIPAGHTQQDSPDLEVDFDNVVLNAQPIPEPGTLLTLGIAGFVVLKRGRICFGRHE